MPSCLLPPTSMRIDPTVQWHAVTWRVWGNERLDLLHSPFQSACVAKVSKGGARKSIPKHIARMLEKVTHQLPKATQHTFSRPDEPKPIEQQGPSSSSPHSLATEEAPPASPPSSLPPPPVLPVEQNWDGDENTIDGAMGEVGDVD